MNLKSLMTKRLYKHLMLPAALIAANIAMPASSQASLLIGTLNFNGNVIIKTGLIQFTNSTLVPNGQITVGTSTGDFAGDSGLTGTLKDITNNPVGGFPIPTGAGSLPDFLTAGFIPLTTHFNMTFLFPGNQGTAGCGTGGNCTPPNTPYNLANTQTGSTASFSIMGTELDTTTGMPATFQGLFTAQFPGIPYSTLLSTIAANGSIPTTISGSLVVSQVPEVGSLPMLASGLLMIGLALGLRKYTGQRS
jgi:hypothetical protein